MALNIVDQSYSGTYSSYMILQATYGMDTVEKGLVHMVSNIKKLHTITRLDYTNPLNPNEATPTTDNSNPFTIDGRQIIPQSVMVYEEFNPRSLETDQYAEQLADIILDRKLPQTIESQIMQLVLNRSFEQYENGLWMGATAYQGKVPKGDPRYQLQFFNGYMQRMVNDALINLSSISPVTITTTNVTSVMDDLITQATSKRRALITNKKTFVWMKFLMSPVTAQIYMQYLRNGATFKGNPFDVGYLAPWGGYMVESCAGMPDNTILFLRALDDAMEGNLQAGVNSLQDWNLRIARTVNASELFFVQGRFKWDVNYGWPQEIFMYTTLTAASFTV